MELRDQAEGVSLPHCPGAPVSGQVSSSGGGERRAQCISGQAAVSGAAHWENQGLADTAGDSRQKSSWDFTIYFQAKSATITPKNIDLSFLFTSN